MQISINQITIKDRIRKEFGNIDELATDIKENGLINPPVITPDHTLIAGERRIKACQLLGWAETEVRIMEVRDYEHQLKLEISENENRKELSHSERVAYAREVERIERVKARERQACGQGGVLLQANFPEGNPKGQSRDIVARSVGYGSGRTYDEAKFVVNNAPPETVAKLDAGEISIHKAYKETKRLQEQYRSETTNITSPESEISIHKTCEDAGQQKREKKRDPVLKPYSYTPPPHVEAPELQKMLEDINTQVMLFYGKFTDEFLKLPVLGDFEYTVGAYADAFRKHSENLASLIQLKKGLEKDDHKIRKSAN